MAPPRSSLSDVAWAVEERLVWGSADALRRFGGLVKQALQQLALVGEERLVWPLQERTDHWSTPLRAAATGGLALLATGALTAGVVLAKGSGGEGASTTRPQAAAVAPIPVPAASQAPSDAPVLKGAAPDFSPEAGEGTAATTASKAAVGATPAAATPASTPSTSSGANGVAASPGPAAIKVARKFAAAFVLYETGRGEDAKVRAVFAETATPELTRSLLKRPPRLPANVKVPEAKVLNVVPGPRSDDTYTFSVSLLRVGVTSELRIEMEPRSQSGKGPATGDTETEGLKQSSEWRVTDVRG